MPDHGIDQVCQSRSDRPLARGFDETAFQDGVDATVFLGEEEEEEDADKEGKAALVESCWFVWTILNCNETWFQQMGHLQMKKTGWRMNRFP